MDSFLCFDNISLLFSIIYSFPDSDGAAFIWKGWHYQWLREEPLVGLETPHRMGSIAGYFDSETHTTSNSSDGTETWKGLAKAQYTFTPGELSSSKIIYQS